MKLDKWQALKRRKLGPEKAEQIRREVEAEVAEIERRSKMAPKKKP